MDTYTLFINSNNKISGTNNNAQYHINWAAFFPVISQNEKYSVSYSFLSTGGYYKDTTTSFYSSAKIYIDFSTPSQTYSTEMNGKSTILGLIARDVQNASASSNFFSCFLDQYCKKTIII